MLISCSEGNACLLFIKIFHTLRPSCLPPPFPVSALPAEEAAMSAVGALRSQGDSVQKMQHRPLAGRGTGLSEQALESCSGWEETLGRFSSQKLLPDLSDQASARSREGQRTLPPGSISGPALAPSLNLRPLLVTSVCVCVCVHVCKAGQKPSALGDTCPPGMLSY